MFSFPVAANSGQTAAMGASISRLPCSMSLSAAMVQSALETEKTLTSVSRSQGRVRALSFQPPQRSTTTRPSSETATAAPGSPRSAKLARNALRTASKRGSQIPSSGVTVIKSPAKEG
ncbi:MAG TPA: hypothetical protein VGG48_18930 [Rhizomicrobium sp.]|jgi:hypothetical protein